MSIAPGLTTDEILDLVFEYDSLPYGTKMAWLKDKSISRGTFRRWQSAVYDGDISRGLVPRVENGSQTNAQERRSMARRKKERDKDAEIRALREKVANLEEVNTTLGKALRLLRDHEEQKPPETQPTQTPGSSFFKRTDSSED